MKSKLLPVLLFFLILLNGVLIFLLIKKPHVNERNQPNKNQQGISFLADQLQFSEAQKKQFIEFDKAHREFMMTIDQELLKDKDVLFNSFQKKSFNMDSLTNKIGLLQAKKESVVFVFFKNVRKICTPDQTEKFDNIIKEALKGGVENRPPPHREEGGSRPR